MVKAGNIAGFEVTYGTAGLFVMAVISRMTNSGLVHDSDVVMTEGTVPASYWGTHLPPADQENCYYIEIHPYTDDTYETVSGEFLGSTRSYQSVILPNSGGGSPADIIGWVQQGQPILESWKINRRFSAMFPNSDCIQLAEIIQGGAAVLIARLINKSTLDPFDLTNATSISACFYNTDGTELTLTLSSGIVVLTPATIGKIQISLTSEQTALLDQTEIATLEIKIALSGGDPIKVQIPNCYAVLESIC